MAAIPECVGLMFIVVSTSCSWSASAALLDDETVVVDSMDTTCSVGLLPSPEPCLRSVTLSPLHGLLDAISCGVNSKLYISPPHLP